MAGAGEQREIAVVQWAVDDLIGRRESVGQDVGFTVIVDISAVVLGSSRCDGPALSRNSGQTGSDGRADR